MSQCTWSLRRARQSLLASGSCQSCLGFECAHRVWWPQLSHYSVFLAQRCCKWADSICHSVTNHEPHPLECLSECLGRKISAQASHSAFLKTGCSFNGSPARAFSSAPLEPGSFDRANSNLPTECQRWYCCYYCPCLR